ncbi:MAG: preprotein translocase subunit SecG [Candidatus Omnitrophica bacterium]|nr:preprotein translocase subunit SecG [Candidatus Omnitrophota bacterium]
MIVFVTALHVVVCFVLILVILLQAGRGQGLAGPSFSSGNVQSLFGTSAGDFLTKATSVSAICFLFTSIGLGYIESHRSKSLLNFHNQASQIDVDAIKKALDRVKSEEKKTTDSTQKKAEPAKASDSKTSAANIKAIVASPAVSEVKAASAQPAAEVKKLGESSVAAPKKP